MEMLPSRQFDKMKLDAALRKRIVAEAIKSSGCNPITFYKALCGEYVSGRTAQRICAALDLNLEEVSKERSYYADSKISWEKA